MPQESIFAPAIEEITAIVPSRVNPMVMFDRVVAIVGRTLEVDRATIHQISLEKRHLLTLSEWWDPGCWGATPVKIDSMPLLGVGLGAMWRDRQGLESHDDQIHPHLHHHGCATVVHGEMRIKSLCWHPFAYTDFGCLVFGVDQMRSHRRWTQEERGFLDVVGSHLDHIFKTRRLGEHGAAQLALLEKEHAFAAIFEGVPLMMIVLDRERRVLRINRQAAEFIGRPAEEMLGRSFGEAVRCVHAQDTPAGCGAGAWCQQCQIRASIARVLRTQEGEKRRAIRHRLWADGAFQEATLSLSVMPLTIRQEGMVLVACHDCSTAATHEMGGQQGHRLSTIAAMATGIAHDFNNILNVINGYTELAMEDGKRNQLLLDDLAEVGQAVNRAKELVRQILTISC